MLPILSAGTPVLVERVTIRSHTAKAARFRSNRCVVVLFTITFRSKRARVPYRMIFRIKYEIDK